jgi:hypothetical protein
VSTEFTRTAEVFDAGIWVLTHRSSSVPTASAPRARDFGSLPSHDDEGTTIGYFLVQGHDSSPRRLCDAVLSDFVGLKLWVDDAGKNWVLHIMLRQKKPEKNHVFEGKDYSVSNNCPKKLKNP